MLKLAGLCHRCVVVLVIGNFLFMFFDILNFSQLVNSHHLHMLKFYPRHHLNRLWTVAVDSPPLPISNPPTSSTWIVQMKVSEDRGWSILLYPSLRLSCLHYLMMGFEVTYFSNPRTERSTQIYICCQPVIRTKILQNSLLYIHNQITGVLERDWQVLYPFRSSIVIHDPLL